ncbi:hypothetical protein B0H19DRAFT_1084016 [Mycena capillaripes]|nr:hypothetical protein B0H19DRAFT_1084016 [Mycena capillaripes]
MIGYTVFAFSIPVQTKFSGRLSRIKLVNQFPPLLTARSAICDLPINCMSGGVDSTDSCSIFIGQQASNDSPRGIIVFSAQFAFTIVLGSPPSALCLPPKASMIPNGKDLFQGCGMVAVVDKEWLQSVRMEADSGDEFIGEIVVLGADCADLALDACFRFSNSGDAWQFERVCDLGILKGNRQKIVESRRGAGWAVQAGKAPRAGRALPGCK